MRNSKLGMECKCHLLNDNGIVFIEQNIIPMNEYKKYSVITCFCHFSSFSEYIHKWIECSDIKIMCNIVFKTSVIDSLL